MHQEFKSNTVNEILTLFLKEILNGFKSDFFQTFPMICYGLELFCNPVIEIRGINLRKDLEI